MGATLKRCDVLTRLDSITEMSDEEVALNPDWIREVAESAYCHIKQRDERHRTKQQARNIAKERERGWRR